VDHVTQYLCSRTCRSNIIKFTTKLHFNIRHYKDVTEEAVGQWWIEMLTELWRNERSLLGGTFPKYASADDRKVVCP